MQIKNPSQGFLSDNQAKFVIHIYVTERPSKKQYTSHDRKVLNLATRLLSTILMLKLHYVALQAPIYLFLDRLYFSTSS